MKMRKTETTTFHPMYSLLMYIAAVRFYPVSAADKLSSSLPGCTDKCGEVEISYPFGISHGCFLPGFEVICNENIPNIAGSSDLSLVEILQGEVRVDSSSFIFTECSNGTGDPLVVSLPEQSPYTFSLVSNRFTLVGCNVEGEISNHDIRDGYDVKYSISTCSSMREMDTGYCTGKGCSQSIFPYVRKSLGFYTYTEPSNYRISSPCSYGFIVEDGSYIFEKSDAWLLNRTRSFTMRLDWNIGEEYCKEASDDNRACGLNSSCEPSSTNSGYLCKCLAGYEGNPYLSGLQGCQYVVYCGSTGSSPCVPEATCSNTTSTKEKYTCICPAGTVGDGLKTGEGCKKQFHISAYQVAMFTIAAVACIALLYWIQKKRHIARRRLKYFHQNGGLLLQQHVSSSKGKPISTKNVKLFSAQELEKATNNYSSRRILGSGAQGTVYRGVLRYGLKVAIKRSPSVDLRQTEQFINEVIMLTEINHKNIVKLLGCCLEMQVPLLVYEFIPGGNLYEKLHGELEQSIKLSWKDRVRIAIEVGEALCYLHSFISMPIYHRDIKSSNILLNESGTAMVADFGISRLISPDKRGVTSPVQGTIGYLDPEYFTSGNLTEKSDVYSFGVVLLEILTGRKPVRHEDTRDYSSLVMHFQSYISRDDVFKILDEEILAVETTDDMKVVARIASRCLNVFGIERPSMKEVVQELLSVANKMQKPPLHEST